MDEFSIDECHSKSGMFNMFKQNNSEFYKHFMNGTKFTLGSKGDDLLKLMDST